MNIEKKISRRNFIALSFMGVGGLALLSLNPFSGQPKTTWRFLTDDEAILLDALVEQIIPTDEFIGAKDAGATNFIDKQLVGPYSRYKDIYRKGLSAIQNTCKRKFGCKFEKLAWIQQTDFLELMEGGKLKTGDWSNGFDKEFFELIRSHTMQSYYGSPRHGGNKKNVSYRMLKLDYPVIIGQNRYNV